MATLTLWRSVLEEWRLGLRHAYTVIVVHQSVLVEWPFRCVDDIVRMSHENLLSTNNRETPERDLRAHLSQQEGQTGALKERTNCVYAKAIFA